MKVKLINPNFTHDYARSLMEHRGIKDFDRYINPDVDALIDPSNLENIDTGAKLILKMVEHNSAIAIIQDCDADGITSAAIAYMYLKALNPEQPIKMFFHEGKQHGLEDVIDDIIDDDLDFALVWQPDAGSNDFVYHERLAQHGISVLVTDHHLAEPPYSSNAVIINNQLSPNYSNKDLSGVGVTWKLCQYIDTIKGTKYANRYIDLVALGVCADMMDVRDIENRCIFSIGFSNINNFFFKTLVEKQSYSMGGKVNPTTVAFYIVPLINAMIRVGTMDEKKRLFQAVIDGESLVESHKRGAKGTFEKCAIESARECTNAKAKQDRMKKQMMDQLEIQIFNNNLLDHKILFIELDDDINFPPELNGLTAMGLAAKYKKPTLLGRRNNEGEIKGSIRGVANSPLESLKNYLDSTEMFDYVTGHDNAAGFGVKGSYIDYFLQRADKDLADYDFGESYYDVNFQRFASEPDIANIVCDIGKYEDLYGQGNSDVYIHIKDINLTKNDYQVIGANKDTLKITKFGIVYMKFHAKDMIEELNQYGSIKLEVVGRCNLNEWGGRVTPQIFIEAYEIKDNTYGF